MTQASAPIDSAHIASCGTFREACHAWAASNDVPSFNRWQSVFAQIARQYPSDVEVPQPADGGIVYRETLNAMRDEVMEAAHGSAWRELVPTGSALPVPTGAAEHATDTPRATRPATESASGSAAGGIPASAGPPQAPLAAAATETKP